MRSHLLKAGFFVAIATLLFWNLHQGSLLNSDEALYAQIAREVSEGHFHPLTYSGNLYWAKPPLFFWLTGGLVHWFTDSDWVYRIIPTLSLLLIMIISFRSFSFVGPLLLLGSPMLMLFSRRVMLDTPVTLCAIALLVCTLRTNRRKIVGMWLFALLGWWIKQHSILPALVAALTVLVIRDRSKFKTREFWIGAAVFLSGCGLLYAIQGGRVPSPMVHVAAAANDAEGYLTRKPVYLDAFRVDSPVLWLLPLITVWITLRWREETKRDGFPFLLASFLYLGSLILVRATLPHYLVPVFVCGLVCLADFIPRLRSKKLYWVLTAALVIQAIYANLFRFDPHNPDIDPAPASKTMALASREIIPKEFPICVFNVYFAGIRYYANRPTFGFYSSTTKYASIAGVSEFQGLVFLTSTEELVKTLHEKCGGYAIVPEQIASMGKELKVFSPLALIQAQPLR